MIVLSVLKKKGWDPLLINDIKGMFQFQNKLSSTDGICGML